MSQTGFYREIVQLISTGRSADAQRRLQQIIGRAGRDPEVLSAAGMLANNQGNWPDAINYFKRALEIEPENAMILGQLGISYFSTGNFEDAGQLLAQSYQIDPGQEQYALALIHALRSAGRLREAQSIAEEIIARQPSGGAISAHLSVLAVTDPTAAIHWAEQYERENSLPIAVYESLPLLGCYGMTPQADISRWARRFGQALADQGRVSPPPEQGYDRDQRPKIGIVTSEFRSHVAASFLLPFVEALKLAGYSVVGYQYASIPDKVTEQFRKLIPMRLFRPFEEHQLIDALKKDRIEMLFDINGYTGGSFSALFVQDLCPAVVHYLGFPNTVGMPGLRYRLVDTVTDEREDQTNYAEQLSKMEPPFLVYRPHDALPEAVDRNALDVVFGSFNNLMKLSDETIQLWSRVLLAVENSKLILKSESSHLREVVEPYLARFAQCGVADRVTILPRAEAFTEHLRLYNSMDIALDPYPYNGTTTTCEALSMGVPLLTLAGDQHRSRVGTTLIQGNPILGRAVANEEAFVSAAAEMARTTIHKSEVRAAFLNSAVCEVKDFSERVDAILMQIWRDSLSNACN